jgi:hypothetical protein
MVTESDGARKDASNIRQMSTHDFTWKNTIQGYTWKYQIIFSNTYVFELKVYNSYIGVAKIKI